MTINREKREVITNADIFHGILGLLCISAVVWVISWAVNLVFSIIGFFDSMISIIGKILVVLGLAVLVALLVALLADAVAPFMNRWRRKKEIKAAISRCPLPRLSTFQGQPSESHIDRWLAEIALRPRFIELFGVHPGGNTFQGLEAEFALFRARELLHAVLGTLCLVFEQMIFSPIYEAYRSGENEALTKWVNDAITATRKRHPLRFTGRVLRIVTFKFGFRAGEGVKRETVEDRGTDRQFIFQLLWKNFWPNAVLIQRWVRIDLGFKDVVTPAKPLPEPESSTKKESERIPLFLPPHEASDIIDADFEEEWVEEREVVDHETLDQPALSDEAISAVDAVVERWTTDSTALDKPENVLNDDEEILRASLPFHPEPNLVYEQLAINQIRRERLGSFEREFQSEMNRDTGELPFETPWISAAILELDGSIQPERFKRLALRHYVNQLGPPASSIGIQPNDHQNDIEVENSDPKPEVKHSNQSETVLEEKPINRHVVEETSPILVPDGF